MRRFFAPFGLIALISAPSVVTAGGAITPYPPTAYTPWPTQVYDPQAREYVTYLLNSPEGGYVYGKSALTGKEWRVAISGDGSMVGQDLDGAKWSYNALTKTYTNETLGLTCASTTPRHVCTG